MYHPDVMRTAKKAKLMRKSGVYNYRFCERGGVVKIYIGRGDTYAVYYIIAALICVANRFELIQSLLDIKKKRVFRIFNVRCAYGQLAVCG